MKEGRLGAAPSRVEGTSQVRRPHLCAHSPSSFEIAVKKVRQTQRCMGNWKQRWWTLVFMQLRRWARRMIGCCNLADTCPIRESVPSPSPKSEDSTKRTTRTCKGTHTRTRSHLLADERTRAHRLAPLRRRRRQRRGGQCFRSRARAGAVWDDTLSHHTRGNGAKRKVIVIDQREACGSERCAFSRQEKVLGPAEPFFARVVRRGGSRC